MYRTVVVTILVCAFLGCGPGPAEGQKAYDAGDYARAMRLWLPLAEQGNRDAQFGVGYMYDKGLGTPADPAEAASWYRKAAEQGHHEAQYDLAVLYHTARDGWEPDLERAAEWYLAASENGNAEAQYQAGKFYFRGLGLPKNFELAAEQLGRCADREPPHLRCLNQYAILLRDGRGLEADAEGAVQRICQAAQLGEPGAMVNLAISLMRGVGVGQDLVGAFAWYELASASGGAGAVANFPEDWILGQLDYEEQEDARRQADAWTVAPDLAEAKRRCLELPR